MARTLIANTKYGQVKRQTDRDYKYCIISVYTDTFWAGSIERLAQHVAERADWLARARQMPVDAEGWCQDPNNNGYKVSAKDLSNGGWYEKDFTRKQKKLAEMKAETGPHIAFTGWSGDERNAQKMLATEKKRMGTDAMTGWEICSDISVKGGA